MNRLAHCAIDIAADCNYDLVIENLLNKNLLKESVALPTGEGALYSHIAINKIIEEELLHDQYAITTDTNNSLKSMSSGEQKKALLQYLINKKPAFIVMDNVLDNLDVAAQERIIATLKGISNDILIIQIINRKRDILSFIEKVFFIKKNVVAKEQNITDYVKEESLKEKTDFSQTIPPALQTYTLPEGPLVKLKNVSVSYDGRPIVNKINWTVNPGEFWQLKGPNGSGKSTLLSLITGDNPKGYGQDIFLFGMQKGTGEAVWDIKKNIGYLTPTMTQFFPRLDSIEKMVLSGFFDSVGLYVVPNETQIKTAGNWLQVIGLSEEKNNPFCFLPLGKQRMVLVARAMVKHPPLLILDEPTSGLNDNDINIFTALINKIAAESATAILYVSHRAEAGLHPQYVFELVTSNEGSKGKVQGV